MTIDFKKLVDLVIGSPSSASAVELREIAMDVRMDVAERLSGSDNSLTPTSVDIQDAVIVLLAEALATAKEEGAQLRKEFEALKSSIRRTALHL